MEKEAIILVAGMGTRLKPLTLENHKCLTEVNGVPILENALNYLDKAGIEHTVLVVGYRKDQIRNRIGNQYKNMKISYAENDRYSETNTSFSLKLGLASLKGADELYVLEGDVFFSEELLMDVVHCKEENVTVLEKFNPDLDGTFVELADTGFVVDWTHKSQRCMGYTVEDKYKTVNIHRFSHSFVEETLIPYDNQCVEEKEGKQPLESVMKNIVNDNSSAVYGMVLTGQKWYEIDDLTDLERAEKIFE